MFTSSSFQKSQPFMDKNQNRMLGSSTSNDFVQPQPSNNSVFRKSKEGEFFDYEYSKKYYMKKTADNEFKPDNTKKFYSPQPRQSTADYSKRMYSSLQAPVRPKMYDYQNFRKTDYQLPISRLAPRKVYSDEVFSSYSFREEQAALKIQSIFRGYRVRKAFWKLRECARKRAQSQSSRKSRMKSVYMPEYADDFKTSLPTNIDPNVGLLPVMLYYDEEARDATIQEIRGTQNFSEDIQTAPQIEDEKSCTVVLFGGINPRDANNLHLQSAVFIYNIHQNKWFFGGSMPEPRFYHTATLLNGKVYIIGGFDPLRMSQTGELYPSKTVHQFTVKSKRWRNRCNMLQNRAYHGSCASGKKDIIVVGGLDEHGVVLSTAEIYDCDKDQWSFIKPCPCPLLGMGITNLHNCIWVIGGITSRLAGAAKYEVTNTVFSYHLENQTWSRENSLPDARAFCNAVTILHEIWLIGGVFKNVSSEGYLISSSNIFVYSPLEKKWKYTFSLQTAKHAFAIAKTNNRKIYIMGGICSDTKEALTENDILDRNSDIFGEGKALPRRIAGSAGIGLPAFPHWEPIFKWFKDDGNIEDIAATKIQALFRGYLTRMTLGKFSGDYKAMMSKNQQKKVKYGAILPKIDDRKVPSVTIPDWPPKPNPNSSLSAVTIQLGGGFRGYILKEIENKTHLRRYITLEYDVDPNIGLVGFLDDLYKKTRKALGLRRIDPLPFFAHDLRPCEHLRDESVHTILLIGGIQPREPLNYAYGKTVLKYHPLKDRWEYVGLLPEPRNYHCAVYHNDYVYVTGGCDPDKRNSGEMIASKTTFCLDVKTMDWERKAPLNCARAFHSMIVHDDKLYVIGGRDDTGRLLASVEEYMPETDEWITRGNMDNARMGMACITHENRIWCFGGVGTKVRQVEEDDSAGPAYKLRVLNTVGTYNLSNHTWENRRPLRCPRAYSTCLIIGKEFWLCTGCCRLPNEKFLVSMASIDCYDPAEVEWRRKTIIANPRHAAAITSVEDCIYIFGGVSSQEWSAQFRNEMIIASDHSIHTCKNLPVPLTGSVAVTIPPKRRTFRAVSIAAMVHNRLTA